MKNKIIKAQNSAKIPELTYESEIDPAIVIASPETPYGKYILATENFRKAKEENKQLKRDVDSFIKQNGIFRTEDEIQPYFDKIAATPTVSSARENMRNARREYKGKDTKDYKTLFERVAPGFFKEGTDKRRVVLGNKILRNSIMDSIQQLSAFSDSPEYIPTLEKVLENEKQKLDEYNAKDRKYKKEHYQELADINYKIDMINSLINKTTFSGGANNHQYAKSLVATDPIVQSTNPYANNIPYQNFANVFLNPTNKYLIE